jgi:hypothetical protein
MYLSEYDVRLAQERHAEAQRRAQALQLIRLARRADLPEEQRPAPSSLIARIWALVSSGRMTRAWD